MAIQHIVSIGGGFSSTIELPLAVLKKYPAENVHFVISCLAGESADLWRLVAECERLTGKHVKRITYQPYRQYLEDAPECMWWDIWDHFEAEGMMGNSLADPCSRRAKREPIRAWMEDHFERGNAVMHVGITRDEIDRQLAITANWKRNGYDVAFDLCDMDLKGSSKERCRRLLGWSPRVYEWGGSHNNCGGFCVKAGHGQMARLLSYEPDLFYYHAEKERLFQINHKTTSTIMRDRKTVLGRLVSTPLTLYEFADRMKARWAGMLPGFEPFEELDNTETGCKACNAA